MLFRQAVSNSHWRYLFIKWKDSENHGTDLTGKGCYWTRDSQNKLSFRLELIY